MLVRPTCVPNKRTHPRKVTLNKERRDDQDLGIPNQRGDEAQHLETPELGMFSRASRRTQSNDPQNKRSHEKGIGKEVHEVPERERAPGCEAQQLVDLCHEGKISPSPRTLE